MLIELLAVSNPAVYVSQGFKGENGTENVKVLFKGENQYEIVFAGGNSFCVCCYDPRIRAQKEGLAWLKRTRFFPSHLSKTRKEKETWFFLARHASWIRFGIVRAGWVRWKCVSLFSRIFFFFSRRKPSVKWTTQGDSMLPLSERALKSPFAFVRVDSIRSSLQKKKSLFLFFFLVFLCGVSVLGR